MAKKVSWAAALLFTALAFPARAQLIDMDQARSEESFRWAVRAFHNGYFNDAVLSLEKALSLKPVWPLPRLWLGRALYKSGFEEAALAEWKQVLDAGQGSSLLRNQLQLIYQRRGLGQELKAEEKYVVSSELGSDQAGSYPFRRPSSVRPRQDGTAYLVAFGTGEILLLDANNQIASILRGELKGFDRPFDCLEAGGFLFVSEYGGNRISRCDLSGKKLKEFGGGAEKLLGPQYLATDGKGYLYVSDWGNARVVKYDLEGNFILAFGGKLSPSSRLSSPTGIAVLEERVYVADRAGRRIEVFDASGNYLAALGGDFLQAPEALFVENPGALLVADGNRVLEFRLEQETWRILSDLSGYAKRLTSVALGPNGQVYAADFDASKLFVLSEMSSLYAGLSVGVERVTATAFPTVYVEVSVEDRWGKPMIGLREENFILSESHQPVRDAVLLRTSQDEVPLEAVVLVEKTPALAAFSGDVAAAVEKLRGQLQGRGGLQVVSVGEKPVLEADFGSSRLEVMRAAQVPPKGSLWRLDLAARLAASQLAARNSRRVVVLMTQGKLPSAAFKDRSLAEISRFLRNNYIAFYAVSFGPEPASQELAYLCAETGGQVYHYFAPAGMEGLVGQARARIIPLYTLRYTSRSDPKFGSAYIDLQAEVNLQRKSGRDESGYYAPLSQ